MADNWRTRYQTEQYKSLTDQHWALLQQHHEQTVDPQNKVAVEAWVNSLHGKAAVGQELPQPLKFMTKVEQGGEGHGGKGAKGKKGGKGEKAMMHADWGYPPAPGSTGAPSAANWDRPESSPSHVNSWGAEDSWGAAPKGGGWDAWDAPKAPVEASWDDAAGPYDKSSAGGYRCFNCDLDPSNYPPFCPMTGKPHFAEAHEFPPHHAARYLVLTSTGEVVEGLSRNAERANDREGTKALFKINAASARKPPMDEDDW